MRPNTICVLEKRPRWAPELERQFAGEDVHIRGVCAASDIADRCETRLVVADLETAGRDTLAVLSGRSEVPVVVIGARTQAHCEWQVRELGAIAYLTQPVSGDDLAGLCRKVLGNAAAPSFSEMRSTAQSCRT